MQHGVPYVPPAFLLLGWHPVVKGYHERQRLERQFVREKICYWATTTTTTTKNCLKESPLLICRVSKRDTFSWVSEKDCAITSSATIWYILDSMFIILFPVCSEQNYPESNSFFVYTEAIAPLTLSPDPPVAPPNRESASIIQWFFFFFFLAMILYWRERWK